MSESVYHSFLDIEYTCFTAIATSDVANCSQYTERLCAQMTDINPYLPTLKDTCHPELYDSTFFLLDILAKKIVDIKSLETSHGMFLACINKHFSAKKFNKLEDVIKIVSIDESIWS